MSQSESEVTGKLASKAGEVALKGLRLARRVDARTRPHPFEEYPARLISEEQRASPALPAAESVA